MPSISPFLSPLFNLGSHTVRSCTCEPHESVCVKQCCVLRKKALHAVLIKAKSALSPLQIFKISLLLILAVEIMFILEMEQQFSGKFHGSIM